MILDNAGKERFRLESYLPREEFVAQLEMGLARVAFVRKQWADAEDRYNAVVARHATAAGVPQAMYWAAVSHYKKTKDHTVLGRVAQDLSQRYPDNLWTKSASVWLPATEQKTA